MFSVRTTAKVSARAEEVWKKLVPTGNWGAWNERFGGIDGTPTAGFKTTLHVTAGARRIPVGIRYQVVEKDRELRWSGGIPGIFVGSHYFRINQLDEGVEIVHGEDFTGIVPSLLGGLIQPKIEEIYNEVTQALAHSVQSE